MLRSRGLLLLNEGDHTIRIRGNIGRHDGGCITFGIPLRVYQAVIGLVMAVTVVVKIGGVSELLRLTFRGSQ